MMGGGSLPFEGLRPAGKRWPPPAESFLGKLEAWLAESRFAVSVAFLPEAPELSAEEAILSFVPDAPGAASFEVSVFTDGESEPEFHFTASGTLPADALPPSLKRYTEKPREILWAGENDLLDEGVILDMCRGVAEGRIVQCLLSGGKWILGSQADLHYDEIGPYSYYSGLTTFGESFLLPFLGLARIIEIRYRAWDCN